ncbi:MAG: hypothetical protein ACP6IU_12105 [Candidatus Asgardarchaeia archaeon]
MNTKRVYMTVLLITIVLLINASTVYAQTTYHYTASYYSILSNSDFSIFRAKFESTAFEYIKKGSNSFCAYLLV